MDVNNIKLGIIGCGKMGSAIIRANIDNNLINYQNINAYDVNLEASKYLQSTTSCNIKESIKDVLNSSDVVLLSVKPYCIDEILPEIKDNYNNQLILSVLAGVKIEKYLSAIPNLKLIRIMPNTPALVKMGMSAICPSQNVNEEDIDFAYKFMNNCGRVIKTTEDNIDVITALSGSGPAFYYKFIELMAISAHKLGLDYKEALLLSAQTALGSAEMVLEHNFDINQLIKNVTTPGGCTEVGNNVLNNSQIDKIIDKTIEDTMRKAIELG